MKQLSIEVFIEEFRDSTSVLIDSFVSNWKNQNERCQEQRPLQLSYLEWSKQFSAYLMDIEDKLNKKETP
jgi:hypothetical protein